MADEVPKKRRRRRLATPPPDDAPTVIPDLYDKSVCSTFESLTSGSIPILKCVHAPVSSASSSEETVINSPIIDLDESITEVPVEPEDPEFEEPPSPPPPPVEQPVKPHRLGNGVRAAFNMLEKIRTETEMGDKEEYNNGLRVVSSADWSPDTPVRSKLKVRVSIPSGVVRYDMATTDRILTLRERIAQKEDTTINRISIFYKDSPICEQDTPKSLGLTVADTLEAYVLAADQVDKFTSSSPESISIKVQGKGGSRDVTTINIGMQEPLEVLMQQIAEKKEMELSSLTFYFDGEQISRDDTPSSLEIEDGDCIDVTC